MATYTFKIVQVCDGGSNAVTINVKDDGAVNVVDCYVEIWDSAGTSFISRTNTNSSGNVTFNLDSNTYIVKMHKTGYYFKDQTLVVNGTESEAYTGTILTLEIPILNVKKTFVVPAETLYKISDIA